MKIALSTIIFSLIYIYLSNEGCDYLVKDEEIDKTDDKFLSPFNIEEEKQQKCYSLSNFKGEEYLCCYNKKEGCFKAKKDDKSKSNECPKESNIINNCGLVIFMNQFILLFAQKYFLFKDIVVL